MSCAQSMTSCSHSEDVLRFLALLSDQVKSANGPSATVSEQAPVQDDLSKVASEADGKGKQDKKSKKKKEQESIDVLEALVTRGFLSASQLENARLATGSQALVPGYLIEKGMLTERDLGSCLPTDQARTMYLLSVEDEYTRHLGVLMERHRRHFHVFLATCAVSTFLAFWFADQLPPGSSFWGAAAFCTLYQQIQRRYYDVQAFFKQSRASTLSSIKDSCAVSVMDAALNNMRHSLKSHTPHGLTRMGVLHAGSLNSQTDAVAAEPVQDEVTAVGLVPAARDVSAESLQLSWFGRNRAMALVAAALPILICGTFNQAALSGHEYDLGAGPGGLQIPSQSQAVNSAGAMSAATPDATLDSTSLDLTDTSKGNPQAAMPDTADGVLF